MTMMLPFITALLIALASLSKTTNAWVLSSTTASSTPRSAASSTTTALSMAVEMANGRLSFDRVCREWRCKYEGDKSDSKSLEAIAGVVEDYLQQIKSVSSDITVNRLVCGACKDFKLMMTVPLSDFGPWEAKEFAPEADFLQKISAIPGVTQVETQTITNMEI